MIISNEDDDDNDNGSYKMLRWFDYFDAQELLKKLSICVDAWDTTFGAAAAETAAAQSLNNTGKKKFQILGMSLSSTTATATLQNDAVLRQTNR